MNREPPGHQAVVYPIGDLSSPGPRLQVVPDLPVGAVRKTVRAS